MEDIYGKLRQKALKDISSQFMGMPLKPSLGMIMAAADTADVFTEGDMLWQWFDAHERPEDREDVHVSPDLVDRFGWRKAYAMTCLADMWALALHGVELWLRNRSRNPFSGERGDMIHYLPDRCPPGGWPPDKSSCTEEHKVHARCASEPFRTYWTAWQGFDNDDVVVAPRRLPVSAVTGMARCNLSVAMYCDMQEVVAFANVPHVPGWSRESSFDEEERYDLMFAAMWRGAVSWLMSGDAADAVPFPRHPSEQAVIMSDMVFRHHSIWSKADDYIMRAPYDRISVFAEKALLTIATSDGLTSYWYQETGGQRHIRNEGLSLSVGRDTTGLAKMLARVSAMKIEKVEALSLAEDWSGADG